MEKTYYKPLNHEHDVLRDIADHKQDTVIDPSKYANVDATIEAEQARDMIWNLKKTKFPQATNYFRHIECPDPYFCETRGFWIVPDTLNETGMKMLQALNSGMVWNDTDLEVALEETINFYNEKFNEGEIESSLIELLSQNTLPEMENIRAKALCFKISATIEDGYLVNKEFNFVD